MMNPHPYKIRHVVLDAQLIVNLCGPSHAGDAEAYIQQMNSEQQGFYDKLERSIKNQGFRNPILVNAGYVSPRRIESLPLCMREDPSKILCCFSNGGSRLWIATKFSMQIPCIVSDFGNCFSEPKIESLEELLSFYKDEPQGIEFKEWGLTIRRLPHSHFWD